MPFTSRMWCTTAKLSVSEVIAWGVLYYTFAVCMPFMEVELGWSPTRLSVGFSVALLVAGISAPLCGYWADRNGTRGLMVGGAIVGSAGIALWGWASSFPVYISAWVLIGLAQAATLYDMAFATVVQAYPSSRRKLIILITLAGAVASTIFSPLSGLIFAQFGWREGLFVLAAAFAVIIVPLNASLPVAKIEPAAEVKGKQEKRIVKGTKARPFWVLGFSLMLASAVSVAMSTFAVAFFIDKGLSVGTAAAIAGSAGVAKLAGRVAISAGKWFSAASMLRGSLFLQATALLLPVLAPSTATLLVMMTVFGATSGARTILRPLLIVEIFGSSNFATNSGLLQAVATFAKSATPIGLGVTVGILGFDGAWVGLAALAFISGSLLFLLPTAVIRQ